MPEFDACIVGSGAGASPVAATLAGAGYRVAVLEKGPWLTETDFYKDELACCVRRAYKPRPDEQPHVLEDRNEAGDWRAAPTSTSGRDFWNGNCVGGSSNFMSGLFHRLKPADFRLRSTYPPIDNAAVVDWPIDYADLEPYYTRVELEVGVSGRVVDHPRAEPRSTNDFPFPPTSEHPLSARIDTACREAGMHPLPVPRAILSQPLDGRRSCEYSGYCGGYGCSSGAKGGARAALLDRAVRTGNCTIYPEAQVYGLTSDAGGNVIAANYYDPAGETHDVTARIFVVACQAIETSRLLLLSTGPKHPDGLANGNGQVGKNLIFSTSVIGAGDFPYAEMPAAQARATQTRGPFINRALQDWYVIEDPTLGGPMKGGTIELVIDHPNPVPRANALKWDPDGKLLWGVPLQDRMQEYFTSAQYLKFEGFADWLPHEDCFVGLDPDVVDKWGSPVARIRLGYHPHNRIVAEYLGARGEAVMRVVGARNIRSRIFDSPPPNLVAGGCRFGNSPEDSVLDPDCRAHEVENLFVTDGSFMPTGGSVPYTWTIYANAFRVAERIATQLG
ncbi:MAG TPA: GMC family oxidoreductase [Gammaproteobacteria bacterium]|nr:GMC family oxidoreductase [Gammaproteobacteria bacterium]